MRSGLARLSVKTAFPAPVMWNINWPFSLPPKTTHIWPVACSLCLYGQFLASHHLLGVLSVAQLGLGLMGMLLTGYHPLRIGGAIQILLC